MGKPSLIPFQVPSPSRTSCAGSFTGAWYSEIYGIATSYPNLVFEPGKVDMLPRDVSALLVPKTLFGERYVQLSIPDGTRAPHLAAGDVIEQDRSANAVRKLFARAVVRVQQEVGAIE